MQDYAKQLLSTINQYDADNPESVNHLRDLVCWISDNDALKKDKVLAQLLYIASQKMRVFGYNMLNGYSEDPNEALATLEDISLASMKKTPWTNPKWKLLTCSRASPHAACL